jgi:hypothetical protein
MSIGNDNMNTPETDAEHAQFAMGGFTLDFCRRLERERDEAIRQLNNIKATEIHTCHDQCKRPMCVLRRERDEAREALDEEMKFHHRTHGECVIAQCQLMDVTNERDKARHEIEGWKNKWECAVDMAARAENQRDEYKALLIRIYNDINVLHTGEAIKELTREFRDENFN